MAEHGEREVYFEFTAIGNAVKVTAIDSVTGIEVSAMGPASAAQADLQQLALQKLKLRLNARIVAAKSTYCGCARPSSKPWRVFGRYGRPSHPWRAQCPCLNPPRKPSRIRCFPPRWPTTDPEIADAIGKELGRQRDEIELIASENIVSRAVLEAQGSVLTNKYAEGLPGKRYYGGCQYVDVAETLAIDRVKKLFGAGFANVQPHSGASANAGGVHGADAAGRHVPRLEPRRRRPSQPRLAGQLFRQVVQGGALRRAPRRPSHRYGRGRAGLPSSTARR